VASDEDPVLEIAGAIADGSPLDWSALDHVKDDALGELRIIAEIAALHRKDFDEGSAFTPGARPRPPDEQELSKAERWGPLLLLERVGGGGFGEVYRAWDPALDHEVALKLLRLPPRASPGSTTTPTTPTTPSPGTVIREAQLLARVRHPNVITVHGALEQNGRIGIWMDFLRGRTLDRVVLDEGPMSAAEAAIAGDSLCRAVAAVHRGGLLHRDIKASNVMREAGGRIVLLDFGTGSELARASAPATTQRIAGTPLYMAPELFDGVAPSIASDIYSLGVLLFFLVSGTHPVGGRSISDIRSAHQAGRRVLLVDVRSDLPRAFISVVERALSREPEARYQSAGAMLHDLAATAVPSPVPPRDAAGGSATATVWAASAAGGLAGAVLLCATLGYVTSAAFDIHLGIGGDFVSEGPLAYVALGAQNLVPTLIYMGIALLVVYAAGALVDMTTAVVPAFRAPVARAREAWQAAIRRANLDDVNMRVQVACAAGAIVFGAICWIFRDVIAGVTSQIDDAPLETLSILHPMYVVTHVLYGFSLDMLLLLLLVGLFQVLRARRATAVRAGPVLGMISVAGLALLFHALAWRILFKNEFRQATFEGRPCYLLARHLDELLVHCPQSEVHRNRVVDRADPRLQLTGRVEQVSNGFVSRSTEAPH
jgi:hypothetical protein